MNLREKSMYAVDHAEVCVSVVCVFVSVCVVYVMCMSVRGSRGRRMPSRRCRCDAPPTHHVASFVLRIAFDLKCSLSSLLRA